jgi:nicotinamide-nucleotide amidase
VSAPDAEIIAVGSELLTHDRIDTNSLFLTEQLNAIGIEVRRKLIVGDERARLEAAIRHALDHMQVIVLTGGLGPTEDDLTREAVAAALDRELVFSEQVFGWIVERFRRINRAMAENNRRQAYLIEGAQPLPNPRGTACGQWIEHQGRAIMLLPGPPHELKPLFTAECVPRLGKLLPPQVIRTRFYRVAGMGESDLDQLIAPVYTRVQNPATTILSGPADIQVHLRARAPTAQEAEALLNQIAPEIEALLGDRIYSHNGDLLEAVIGQQLRAAHATLAVAESLTGGMIAQRITGVAGASDYFLGGFLVYSDAMKTALLGVDASLIEQHTAVSEAVVRAMAEGARARTGAAYAVAITGEAGPKSATGAAPGTVFIAVASPQGVQARELHLGGDRNRVRTLAAQYALDQLRRALVFETQHGQASSK